ncbi:MAG: helix-turn-helix domain-containing protein [Verrucomicrobia bacterium]|nr:helix-turn-helix domain-containing protein [Verrucomicrobiota bacterium]
MNNDLNKLGQFLKRGRERVALSLRAVEESTGISNAYLSQMEGAKVQRPSPVDLHKLCKLYEIPYALAMEYAGYPLPDGMPGATKQQHLLARLGRTTPEEEDALIDYMEFLRAKKRKGR